MNTLDLALKRVKLKKVSTTRGGEWHGPCPGCGGDDRFHVWPAQQNGKGAYWCRGCEKHGDNIQFLRDFDGLSFREALAFLNIEVPGRRDRRGPSPPEYTPETHQAPAALWREKAEKLVAWGRDQLARKPDVLAWLAGRGISAETAAQYRLGWNPGEEEHDLFRPRKSWGLEEVLKENGKPKILWIPIGLVIPYIVNGRIQRVRIRRPEGEPRYYVIPGSSMSTMITGGDRRAFVVVEAELDAIAVSANNKLAGAAAMGSASAKPDASAWKVLQESLQVLDALDYDEAGAKYSSWWREHFDNCDRWPVPQGKDPGEAFKLGIDLDQWIRAGMPPVMTMDYTHPWDEKPDRREKKTDNKKIAEKSEQKSADADLPPAVLELRDLLKKNPGVRILNGPDRYTVLRDGKYVGGRIGELVFRTPEVLDYLDRHPAREITEDNF